MKYNVAISGTFDVENYGDLMFPEVFREAMRQRGMDLDLFLFSPVGSTADQTGGITNKVYSVKEIAQIDAKHPLSAIVIGGGAIIRGDSIPVRMPGKENISQYSIMDSWFTPAVYAQSHGKKLIYNLPQISTDDAEDELFPSYAHAAFDHADYVSFRDELSAQKLYDIYREGEERPSVTVCPDSVCCISDLFPAEKLASIRSEMNLEEPYAVMHFNISKPAEDDIFLLDTVRLLEKNGYKVVLLPLGYAHRDDLVMKAFNEKAGGTCRTFDRKLNILEMAAVLAGCSLYVGTSFHGAITAMSYGKKAVSYNCIMPYYSKNSEIFRQMGVEKYAVWGAKDLKETVETILSDNAYHTELASVKEKINRHFDKIYSFITLEQDGKKGEDNQLFVSLLCHILEGSEKNFAKLKNLENANRDLENANRDLEKANRDLEKQTEDLRQKNDSLRQLAIERMNTIRAIQNSKAWRITAPLRWCMGKLRAFLGRHPKLKKFIKGCIILLRRGPKGLKRFRSQTTSIRCEIDKKTRKEQEKTEFNRNIKYSILVPLYNTPIDFLREMIDSVIGQTYKNWELCLADGSDEKHPEVGECCLSYCKTDHRIVYKKLAENKGISGNTNACIDMATGNYIALFDHDDVLHPSVLYKITERVVNDGADYVYTDETTFESPNINNIVSVHCKPDYAPDNLRANNYICHFSAFSREVLEKAGRFRSQFDGSQDHDLILRLTSVAEKVVHIPEILYFWRSHPLSVAMDINSKAYAITAGRNAVKESVSAMGYDSTVLSSRAFPTIYDIRYELKGTPTVSIILPVKNHYKNLRNCVESILSQTTYDNYELIIVDNGSSDEKVKSFYGTLRNDPRVRILERDMPMTHQQLCRYGVTEAKGEHLMFMRSTARVISDNWIQEMLMYSQRSDVGAVGAMIYYPDDTVCHAGLILGLGKDGIAGSPFYKSDREAIGYMGRMCYAQDLSAVSDECIMIRREVWEKVDGYSEDITVYPHVDLCLKIRAAGYLVVWTPYAELYHGEKTDGEKKEERSSKRDELRQFKEKWGDVLQKGDPYYNPNLSLASPNFELRYQGEK